MHKRTRAGRGAGRSSNPCRGAYRCSSSTRGFASLHPRLISLRPAGTDYVTVFMKSCTKGSRRNKFTFWRERRAGRCEAPRRSRCRTSSRSGNKADTAPFAAAPPAARRGRWLCCALLTYRPGYCSSLAPRQRAWGAAAKCEFISARALSPQPKGWTPSGAGRVNRLRGLGVRAAPRAGSGTTRPGARRS